MAHPNFRPEATPMRVAFGEAVHTADNPRLRDRVVGSLQRGHGRRPARRAKTEKK